MDLISKIRYYRFDNMDKNFKKTRQNIEEKEEECIYDEITGARGKKTALSLLNKRLVGDHEMDELFCDWG